MKVNTDRTVPSGAATNLTQVDPQHVVITQAVPDSDIPVHLMYVEMIDGVYSPIGLRKPAGSGPFPLVLFASGNGGGGMAAVADATRNRSWTQEQFLAAGYAVAWLRYRAEVDYAYDRVGKLIEDRRQGRQLFNRGPLEYEDVISIIEHAKTLPDVAPARIGYMGMSHGGEMAFKIASETATSCKGSFGSVTTSCASSARKPSGRPTSTSCTVSFTSAGPGGRLRSRCRADPSCGGLDCFLR